MWARIDFFARKITGTYVQFAWNIAGFTVNNDELYLDICVTVLYTVYIVLQGLN